jgi:hypothetical protein
LTLSNTLLPHVITQRLVFECFTPTINPLTITEDFYYETNIFIFGDQHRHYAGDQRAI